MGRVGWSGARGAQRDLALREARVCPIAEYPPAFLLSSPPRSQSRAAASLCGPSPLLPSPLSSLPPPPSSPDGFAASLSVSSPGHTSSLAFVTSVGVGVVGLVPTNLPTRHPSLPQHTLARRTHCSTGVLECWRAGVPEYQRTGVPEYQRTGVAE
eukprot:2797075-Rhodomonas_salina.1